MSQTIHEGINEHESNDDSELSLRYNLLQTVRKWAVSRINENVYEQTDLYLRKEAVFAKAVSLTENASRFHVSGQNWQSILVILNRKNQHSSVNVEVCGISTVWSSTTDYDPSVNDMVTTTSLSRLKAATALMPPSVIENFVKDPYALGNSPVPSTVHKLKTWTLYAPELDMLTGDANIEVMEDLLVDAEIAAHNPWLNPHIELISDIPKQ